MNGSANRFQDPAKLRSDVIQLVRDYGVSALFVPIITSDGRVSYPTKLGREQKYGNRDILQEVHDAVIAAGRTVGKGNNDVIICAWVEGPFTVYVGKTSPGSSTLNPVDKWGPFAKSIQSAVLRDPDKGYPQVLSAPALESRYGDGTVYLNPFSTLVKDNLRKTILEAAYKGWVYAIIVDDLLPILQFFRVDVQ
jgi:hypothetical protein